MIDIPPVIYFTTLFMLLGIILYFIHLLYKEGKRSETCFICGKERVLFTRSHKLLCEDIEVCATCNNDPDVFIKAYSKQKNIKIKKEKDNELLKEQYNNIENFIKK